MPTAPLDRANVDTDQIIPKQFLKRIERTGFGEFLFFDWRNTEDDFVLARPEFRHAPILVAGANFGSGSSREHAPWALQDWGYRAILAPSFADIFRSNCAKVGLLCVVLPEAAIAELLAAAPAEATVDLDAQTVTLPSGRVVSFEIDPRTRDEPPERLGRHRADVQPRGRDRGLRAHAGAEPGRTPSPSAPERRARARRVPPARAQQPTAAPSVRCSPSTATPSSVATSGSASTSVVTVAALSRPRPRANST